jgi:hypothetical protein
MGRTCSKYGEEVRCIQGFGGKPERKRPPARPRHGWVDNIRRYLEEG